MSKPTLSGVYVRQHLNFHALREGSQRKGQGQNRDWGKPTVRDRREACGNVCTKEDGLCGPLGNQWGHPRILRNTAHRISIPTIGLDLREGKQHSAREADLFLGDVIVRACELVSPEVALLIREDSGFDSEKIYAVAIDQSQMRQANGGAAIDFLIKWNPRKTPVQEWYSQRCDEPALWKTLREGKRVCEWEEDVEFEHAGKRYRMRRYYRMIERTIDKDGIVLLIPDVELDAWNTTLKVAAPEVTALYQDHGTHEQFHSEFKTDLDLERLPSTSFSMNALVLCLAMLAFNILRAIGQSALLSDDAPIRQKRQKVKRRRVRTVIDTMIHIAAKFVRHARRLVLHFSAYSPSFVVFERLYRQWAAMSLQL